MTMPLFCAVKTGGVYVPPFKLARMMAEASQVWIATLLGS